MVETTEPVGERKKQHSNENFPTDALTDPRKPAPSMPASHSRTMRNKKNITATDMPTTIGTWTVRLCVYSCLCAWVSVRMCIGFLFRLCSFASDWTFICIYLSFQLSCDLPTRLSFRARPKLSGAENRFQNNEIWHTWPCDRVHRGISYLGVIKIHCFPRCFFLLCVSIYSRLSYRRKKK